MYRMSLAPFWATRLKCPLDCVYAGKHQMTHDKLVLKYCKVNVMCCLDCAATHEGTPCGQVGNLYACGAGNPRLRP